MRGFDQRRLAHAARAPQQGIVGRQAFWRSARCSRSRCRARGRCPGAATSPTRLTCGTGASYPSGCQTKASATVRSRRGRAARRQPLQRVGDARQHVGVAPAPWPANGCLSWRLGGRLGWRLAARFEWRSGLRSCHWGCFRKHGAALSEGRASALQAGGGRNGRKMAIIEGAWQRCNWDGRRL